MLKTILYYFSGTGNNLFLAKEIAKRMPGTVIRPIKELEHNKVLEEQYDWIGFLGPSYYSHIPPYMMECMSGIVYTDTQKVVTICGCGGNRGMALQDMRKQINASGKETSLEYSIIQPGNYLLSYGAFPKIYQDLTRLLAKWKVKRIVQNIQKNKTRKNRKPGLFYKTSDEERLQSNIHQFAERGKQFHTNQNCVNCGMCTKVCPVGNIKIEEGKVVFSNHCNQCMACIQWCPKRAISYDQNEGKRKRYHHPDVKAGQMQKRA